MTQHTWTPLDSRNTVLAKTLTLGLKDVPLFLSSLDAQIQKRMADQNAITGVQGIRFVIDFEPIDNRSVLTHASIYPGLSATLRALIINLYQAKDDPELNCAVTLQSGATSFEIAISRRYFTIPETD